MEPTQSDENNKSQISRLYHRIYHKLDSKNLKASIISYRKRYGLDYSDDVLYTSDLTGLHPSVVLKLKHDSNDLRIRIQAVDRAVLLKALTYFYLNKQILPTTRDLFDALQGTLPLYVDIASFRKQLALMDFMWREVKNKFYVIERPEVTYERYKFLKLVLEYHDNNRPIFFIDELAYAAKRFYTSVSDGGVIPTNATNVQYAISNKSAIYKTVTEYNQNEFKRFICDVLIPNLTEHSLIVIKNASYCCEKDAVSTPNIKSTMEDMKKWLDRNNVPYNDDASKAELYFLAQTCTNNDQNTYFVDSIIKANGHNVIRLPDHIEQLTPTTLFFDLIQNSISKFRDTKTEAQGIMFQIFNNIDQQRLMQMYGAVVNKYRSLYQDDVKVEDLLDTLIAKMSYNTLEEMEDSDIPSDDSD